MAIFAIVRFCLSLSLSLSLSLFLSLSIYMVVSVHSYIYKGVVFNLLSINQAGESTMPVCPSLMGFVVVVLKGDI